MSLQCQCLEQRRGNVILHVAMQSSNSITAVSSNCVTDYNSNGLYIENTVCQGQGLWEVYSSNTSGNLQGAYVKNIYSEANLSGNPSSPAKTPSPGLGVGGLIVGASGQLMYHKAF
jgi:hypothetical protein